jgi:hypothetical protein
MSDNRYQRLVLLAAAVTALLWFVGGLLAWLFRAPG